MKQIIDRLLAIFSPLAAIPTGWAIYAGVTKQPAFPMNPYAAAVGAIAIIFVDIAAATLVTDISTFNLTLKNQTEKKLEMSTFRAWAILGIAILAEIILALVIVVVEDALVYGVLVFPIITGAGVFAFAVRNDLQRREQERDELRRIAKKSKRTPNEGTKKSVETPKKVQESPLQYERKCDYCDAILYSPQAIGGHMKKHHPEMCAKKVYAVDLQENRK